jgi:hypothetical protein
VRRPRAVGVRRLRHLKAGNARLRKLVADLALDEEMPQEVVRRRM